MPSRPPSLLVTASLHRSGSTFLQRYVTAATDIFVWGESGWLLHALRQAYDGWPGRPRNAREYRKVMADPSLVERAFLPNLAPPPGRLLDSLRRTLLDLYADRPPGFDRWGWKAVRYGRREIDFARTLFPDLRVVLLVRDPWSVARSIRRKGWIDRRGYFEDVAHVARQWRERTVEYRELASVDDPSVHWVQYEQLHDRIGELNDFLGVAAESRWSEISKRKLGSAPRFSRWDLTTEDVETIASIAGDVASELGYVAPIDAREHAGALH